MICTAPSFWVESFLVFAASCADALNGNVTKAVASAVAVNT